MKLKQLSLLDVLDDYGIEINKKGLEYWASCPFHADENPSFSISAKDDNYVWYCFSCKRGGGVLDFVSEIESIPKPAAIEHLSSKYDLDMEMNPNKQLLTQIVKHLELPSNKYLKERGISERTAEKYRIGYCEDYNDLLDRFDIDHDRAASIGLYDITNQIIYPFYDHEGCFRIASRSINEKAYNGSHKTDLWKYHLWGIEHVKTNKVYVFEGYHDVMIASEYGISAVALCGTNMPKEYWQQLKYYGIEELVFVPDGDYAGEQFLLKLIENYDSTFNITVVALVEGDPDDHILSGQHKNWKPLTLLEWYTDYKWDPKSLNEKIKMYKDISRFYCKLNEWEQGLYRNYFQDRFESDGLDYLIPEIKPDRKSERIVLANCMYSNNIRIETLQELDAKDFTLTIHKNIFEFMKSNNITSTLIEKNFEIDLSDNVDLVNYKYYIDEVKKCSVRLELYNEFGRSRSKLNNSEPSEIAGSLSSKIISIVDNKEFIYDSGDVVKEVVNTISDRVNNPNVLGISLNEKYFPIINTSLLGFVPQKLILVSGPTGHGKTTIVQNWIDDLIFNKKEKVLFFSLEMSPQQIMEKQIAIHTGIPSTKILTGSLNQSEYDEIIRTAKMLVDSNMKIINGVYNLYKIINIAKSLIMREGYKIVMLDYIQLITISNNKKRYEQLMEITSNIKRQLCNDYDVNFVAISQLGKSALDSDVAEAKHMSGSYGMVADVDVAITVRHKTRKEIKQGSNYEIFIDKHRYGRDKVIIPALFDKGLGRIKECAG